MRVFLTGATGFIGSRLARRLVEAGHEVCCLVRDTSDLSRLQGLDVWLVRGSVTDRAVLSAGMMGCRWLFHAANLYSMWEPDPRAYEQVNVQGTRAVMEAALAAGVRRVVHVSTAAVYGKPARVPFGEQSQPGARLFSQYARTKAAGERLAWDFYKRRGLPLTVIEPGIVLGAGDHKPSGRYIQDIIFRRVPGTIFHGSSSTYVYVGDVVEAMLRAAENHAAVGQKYLLGHESLSGSDFVRLVCEAAGMRPPFIHFPDWMVLGLAYVLTGAARITRRPPAWGLSVDAASTLQQGFQFNGSRAECDLGIQYTPIQQAIAEAVEYYRQAR